MHRQSEQLSEESLAEWIGLNNSTDGPGFGALMRGESQNSMCARWPAINAPKLRCQMNEPRAECGQSLQP